MITSYIYSVYSMFFGVKLYRNEILTLTRARVSKKLYFHNYFQENVNNIKNT